MRVGGSWEGSDANPRRTIWERSSDQIVPCNYQFTPIFALPLFLLVLSSATPAPRRPSASHAIQPQLHPTPIRRQPNLVVILGLL